MPFKLNIEFMAIYKKNNYRPNRGKEEKQETESQELKKLHDESTTAEVFDTLDEKASTTEAWVQKNQKSILIAIAAIIVIGLGFLFYQQFVSIPKEKEASNELSYPLQTLDNALNSQDIKEREALLNLSLKGSNGRYGFIEITKKYSGTKAANIANYSAGMAYLNLNKYKQAIEHLEKFESDDQILSALALGNIGDAFAELKQPSDALNYYEKAFKKGENSYTAPMYLFKAGLTAIQTKEYKKAVEYFETIKQEYPQSEEAQNTDTYLAMAKTYKGE